jgi:hypothetical protein
MASVEEVAHDYATRKPGPENAGTSDHSDELVLGRLLRPPHYLQGGNSTGRPYAGCPYAEGAYRDGNGSMAQGQPSASL